MTLQPGISTAKRLYVQTMMQVVGRALQAISQVDDQIRKEIAPLPEGFTFSMNVLPSGPGLYLRKKGKTEFEYLGATLDTKPDLSISFKHINHAFLVLSFQESTSVAFSHNRMLVDGDVGFALRMTRLLNRLETFILPKLLAERAVKEYPASLSLPEKVTQGARIYFQMATNLVTVN
ncbi:MAG: hypothetical protein H7A00_10005 [Hahellaceae bacterium]|nr:hypothetical protein [Hahellaceae bacterium]